MKHFKAFLLLFLLLFSGCDSPVHSIVYKDVKLSTKTLEIVNTDPLSSMLLKETLSKNGFVVAPSEFKISMENRKYANSCNNGLIKSTSNTQFDGMLLLGLYQNETKLKEVFMDYRGDVDSSWIKTLLKKLF